MEKENPDLYKKIYEPNTVVDTLAAEVGEKLNLVENENKSEIKDSSASPSAGEETIGEDGEKKHQSRGGKGLIRDESIKLDKEAQKRAVQHGIVFENRGIL